MCWPWLPMRGCGGQVFFIRGGRLIGRDHFYLRITDGRESVGDPEQLHHAVLCRNPVYPRELMLQAEVEDREVLEEWLTSKRGQKVAIRVPKKGTKEAGGTGAGECPPVSCSGTGSGSNGRKARYRSSERGGRASGPLMRSSAWKPMTFQYKRIRIGWIHGGL